ncbi:SDR family oxidoreductase [Aureitalea marina]|uniref:Short-chain dehydrogenase/reductase n=1 Tax=Aureitalea marina TaxID=930804 RepID=A0A2S7KN53_9FLAO|nr:SDR family oxidoreductase [Aureitalea marina]PQB04055.1 short-chain dehydrogenase/reductase [Aureitalea marina]
MSGVVLITGGSSGLGRSMGVYLQEKGFQVFGTSRNPEGVSDSQFPLVKMDVRSPESIAAGVSEILKNAGRIDVLVNNAGVGITGPLEETPQEAIHNAFQTNVYGPIEVTKAVLPAMREQGSGLIINVTSIAGFMGLPFRGVYSASKGALELITEAWRMELASFGIKMTNLAPGDFATNIAAGRFHAPLIDDSPYHRTYGDSLQLMNEHVDQGMDPEVMANAVYNIIKKNNPKVGYRVGSGLQKFSIVLKKVLPGKMYEKLLMKHYRLNR